MSDAQMIRAGRRAQRLYPQSQGFRTAYMKGVTARLQGRDQAVCPYRNTRGWRSWRTAWLSGFFSV